MNKTYLSRPGQLALALFFAATAAAQSITPPSPLQTTIISNITATTVIDCPTYAACIDNRSQQYRRNNYHAFRVTGTGIWSVQMQYADGTPTSWTSFGSSALVTNASPVSGVGYGLGYHDFISWVITGTATISNYSGSKNYWTAGVTNTFSFPITTPQGGAAGLADVVAGSPAAACTAVGSTGKMLLTATYTGLTTQTLACNISASAGGILKPASGQTITLTGSFDGDLTQHFDLSAGGVVNLAGAKVTALYPQWWGAKCGGVDDTTAVQNTFNVATLNQTVMFPCTSTVSQVYLPDSAQGAILRGTASPGFGIDTAGAALAGNSSGTVFLDYANSVRFENFGIDCHSNGTTGFIAVAALFSTSDNLQVANCTGDDIAINPNGGGHTTSTTSITSGTKNPFTVATINLQGQTIGDGVSGSCNAVTLEYGTSNQETFGYTISGNTITPTSNLVHNHSGSYAVNCNGNDNQIIFNEPRFFDAGTTSGCVAGTGTAGTAPGIGWGFNVYRDPDNDTNSIVVTNPTSYGNACGGMVWSGSVNKLDGGHFEADTGPAIQLGDLAYNSSTFGRVTFGMVITPFQDNEESGGGFRGVHDVCAQNSSIQVKQSDEFLPAAAGSACTALTGTGILDVAFGASSSNSGNDPQFTWQTLNTCTVWNPTYSGNGFAFENWSNGGAAPQQCDRGATPGLLQGYISIQGGNGTAGSASIIAGGAGSRFPLPFSALDSTNTYGLNVGIGSSPSAHTTVIQSNTANPITFAANGNGGGINSIIAYPDGCISIASNQAHCGSGHVLLTNGATPSSSSATCSPGQFSWDSSYLYMCVATNTWKRIGISTW